jgi:uncharacterized oligopeptide transporter (OPT) family protein
MGPPTSIAETDFYRIAFAVGLINTPQFSIARLIGGIIAYSYTRRQGSPALDNVPLVVFASGLVLGEGFASVLGLAVRAVGVGPLSCWGCDVGGGGYCSSC